MAGGQSLSTRIRIDCWTFAIHCRKTQVKKSKAVRRQARQGKVASQQFRSAGGTQQVASALRAWRTVRQQQDVIEEVVRLRRRLQQRDERRVVLIVRRVSQKLDDLVRRAAVEARADLVQEQDLCRGDTPTLRVESHLTSVLHHYSPTLYNSVQSSTAHPLGADEHLSAGYPLLLAAADAPDHLVADLGVGAHFQAEHADDIFRNHALVDALQRTAGSLQV